MKTTNRIMGITSLALGALCIIPSIIGILAGISLMTEDEIVSRIIATVLFELFLFVGGAIATIIPAKPIATIISSVLLTTAGILQIIYNAEFSLVFIGTISLLILSWVAVISIAFGLLLLVFSIIAITKKQKTKIAVVAEQCGDTNMKKCTYCNSDIPNEAKFCSNCGKEILAKDIIPPSIETSASKKKTKNILVIGSIVLVGVILLGIVFSTFGSKDYIFEKVAFGMTKSEVQRAVRYDLEEQSNGSLYHCEIVSDDTQISYQYTFDNNEELKKIEVWYYGDRYTEGNFFNRTKRELDSKHGTATEYRKKNVDKDYGLVWYYDGYEWICDGYNVQFIYWEDGFLKLTFSLDD